MKESSIVTAVKNRLKKEFGGFWIKIHGGLFQMAGLPDLIGCLDGHFFAFEVKCPGKLHTLTERQQYILDQLEKAGATIGVITSAKEGVEIVQSYYKNVGRGRKK